MTPKLSATAQLRLRLRLTLEAVLDVVPMTFIENARRRHILVPLLRHRRIVSLGSFTVSGPQPVRLVAVDSLLTRLLYWHGASGYEGNEVTWWRRFCQEGHEILELGANIGYYTTQGALAAPGTPYTAVEAHPVAVQVLRQNLTLNSLPSVHVIHAAVLGESPSGIVTLALPDQEQYVAPTGAFVTARTEGVAARRAAHTTVSVPAVAIADLVTDVDVIKLDIEGAEYDVLARSSSVLITARAIILVEVLRDTPKLRSLLASLVREQRYGLWLVSEPVLRPLPLMDFESGADLLTRFGTRDVAAIPDERLPSLTG